MSRSRAESLFARKLSPAFAALLILAGLYAASLYDYLLFHSIAEVFAIVIAVGIFMVAWNSRRYVVDHFLLFIGVAFLSSAVLTFVHMLTYAGMNILPGYDANTPTQLWVASRYMQSLSLLAAPLLLRRRVRPGLLFLLYGILTAGALLSILYFRVFPDCYLPAAGGLTPFKKVSEYIICLVWLAAGAFIFRRREHFDSEVMTWLLMSMGVAVLAELAFTTYASVFGFSNLLGHFLVIVSFYMIYKAVIETGLSKPFNLLFRDLHRQREWLRVTLASIGDSVIATDTEGRITYLNPIAAELTGWTAQEALNQPVRDVLRTIDEVSRKPGDDIVGRVLAQGCILKMSNNTALINRKGIEIPIEDSAAPIRDAAGKLIGAVVVFHDVSARRQAEENLRRSTARYELLSSTAGRLLATEDPQGVVRELCADVMAVLDCQVFFNYLVDEQAGQLHLNAWAGIPEAEAHRIEWLDFGSAVCGCVARDERRMIAEDILNQTGDATDLVRSFGIQAYCCHPLMVQGRLIGTLSFGTAARPRFTSDEVELMHTVADQVALAMQRIQNQLSLLQANEQLERKVRDRTAELENHLRDLRSAHEQLNSRAAQLRALAGELTMAEQRERRRMSGILHDGLQQQLAAAKLHVGGITAQLRDSGLKEANRRIEGMLAEAIQMTRSLSADLSPPALHEGGLGAGLEWLASWMRAKYNFKVDLQLAAGQGCDLAEDVKILLFESLRELLFNAVKHAGVSRARVSLQATVTDEIEIAVSDEGAGFDPSQLNREGDLCGGFGLFSIRERLRLIGGRFDIDSTPGKGSRFNLVVPMAQAAAGPAPAETGPVCTRRAGASIGVLLVDDHSIFREGLARLLNKEADMQVVGHAQDALEAIELTRKLRPQVILMDINMPGLSGIEATRIIHQFAPEVRIIGLSMHEDREGGREMLQAGAVAYKNKTCAASELIKTIRAGLTAAAPEPLLMHVLD